MNSQDECWLFVDAAASFGGHEVMLLRWLDELRRQRQVIPVLMARSHTPLYKQAIGRVTTISLPESSLTDDIVSKVFRSFRDAYRLAKLIIQLKPELAVIAEGCLLSHAGFTLLLRLLQLPTVVYVPMVEPSTNMKFGHGTFRDWLVRNFYSRVPDAWITITPQQAKQFSSWAHVVKPVFSLPNTVDQVIEISNRNPAPVQRPINVLVLGRFDAHQKGLDSLLNFLMNHIELSQDMHINLVGDGPFAEEISHRLKTIPLLQQLLSVYQWMPAIDALREHDVLLLPSRYEGVPLVMLEAMAFGIPVIATNLPSTRALLNSDCLFEVGNYEQAMRLIVTSMQPEQRSAIIKRNRATFKAHASGAAFSKAVRHLTRMLLRLSKHKTTSEPVDESVETK